MVLNGIEWYRMLLNAFEQSRIYFYEFDYNRTEWDLNAVKMIFCMPKNLAIPLEPIQ